MADGAGPGAQHPHVTVQNKVAPEAAKRVYETLLAAFSPQHGMVTGFGLWRYLDGPWELLGHQVFRGTFA